jgi:hypothetical protein
MENKAHSREAYDAALRFEHVALQITDRVRSAHREDAEEIAEYTNEMLRCLRLSNNRIKTKKGHDATIQAAVWMVEVLIILQRLGDEDVERPLVTTAIELLERVEDALRREGSLPPALD